jgi:hypothetical protein
MTTFAPVRRSWRWRRCPSCGNVERASDFTVLQYGEPWQYGEIRRQCPNCGHRAPIAAFRVVRERHP